MAGEGYSPLNMDQNATGSRFPSSFLKDERKKDRFCRSYVCRRRIIFCSLISFFSVAATLATLKFGHIHGHVDLSSLGGAGKFLEGSQSTSSAANLKGSSDQGMSAMRLSGRQLSITTWNMAAINNNPFEYWLTIQDHPKYEKLMLDVEQFIESPESKDVPVHKVFTEDMYNKLEARMKSVGWESVRSYWNSDYRHRNIVSQFLKDPTLGSKRLASMPDRVTNTINIIGSDEPVCRPTVINMYAEDLPDLETWWTKWEAFMFDTPLPIQHKEAVKNTLPYEMLKPISKAKYPAILEEEEKVSLPLQTLCGAIFDAILVHMMNTVSTPDQWQPLKQRIVQSLSKQKVPKSLQILQDVYASSDIITLQEVSMAFVNHALNSNIANNFHIIKSEYNIDETRDQNSIILLNKNSFPNGMHKEVTNAVEAAFPKDVDIPIAKGDILALTAIDRDGLPYLIASFHGDTDGLATIPVLNAILAAKNNDQSLRGHRLIFGLDANTYEVATPGIRQDVMGFGQAFQKHALSSCWGDLPDPKNYTTYNARTYLQPQLNKACKSTAKRENGDVNPKDFILFDKSYFEVVKTSKDNTGNKQYIEDMAFPTLDFPSDHGILATVLKPKET